MYLNSIKYCLLIIIIGFVSVVRSQDIKTTSVTELSKKLNESSALLRLNNKWITLNDSGGEAELYEFDNESGKVTRTIKIKDAKNKDWEALAMDENHIYIGDIGNNKGTRKELTIYKIGVNDYLSKDEVKSKKIKFSYANQQDFTSQPQNTQYDAETLFFVEDKLVMVSKNWRENKSFFYEIPKFEGSYSIQPMDSMKTEGKITDGTYDRIHKNVYLCGYDGEPFLTKIHLRNILRIDDHSIKSKTLIMNQSVQVEAIEFINDTLFFTSEKFGWDKIAYPGELTFTTYKIADYLVGSKFVKDCFTFQDQKFVINGKHCKMKSFEIIDSEGSIVLRGKLNYKNKEAYVSLSPLEFGSYTINIIGGKTKDCIMFQKR